MATFNEIPDSVGLLVSGEALRTLRYNGSYESVVCLADNFRGSINSVSVQSYNGELVYVFGNERGGLYGVTNGTYRFLVPQAYPIAFHTAGRTTISYTGQNSQGSKVGLDGNTYEFFWGIVTLTVTGDFGRLSYQSFNNGYLGGFRHIDHTTVCYNSSTNRQKGAEASVSGTSVNNPVAFFATYNIASTAVDAFTTGGVADVFVTRRISASGGATLGGIGHGIKNPITSTVRVRVGGHAAIEGGALSNPIVKGGQTSGTIPSPGGGVVWQNTSGALREQELQSATLFFDNDEGLSNFLYISNLSLDLPPFAIPTGISVRIRKSSSVGEIVDDTVALAYKVGDNLLITQSKGITGFWPQTASSFNYGGTSDTWGRLWSRSEVIAPEFGVVISALGDPSMLSRAAIDYVEFSVYYLQLIEEQTTGGSSVSGSAEYNVITQRLPTSGILASGVALNIYLNIDAQGGANLSGECIVENFFINTDGLLFIGGSSDVQLIVNGNSQSVVFLRINSGQNAINAVSVRPVGPTWRGDWLDTIYNKDDIVKENNIFYVCLQHWDASETRTPTEDIGNYGGAYWATYTGPLFYVFGEDYGNYGIISGTYKFNIPAAYPIAFLNFGRPTISFTGTQPQGSKVGLDGNTYNFYYGEVTLTVTGAWNRIAFGYQSWNNEYLGGQNNIVYSAAATGQNTDLVLGGAASISINFDENASSGIVNSGTSTASIRVNPIIESYGATLSGEASRVLQLALDGGSQLGGSGEVNQVFTPFILPKGFLANGNAAKFTNYKVGLGTNGILLTGLGAIAIQPKIGDGLIVASGTTTNLTSFNPVLVGHATVSGSYILQQTYNSIKVVGYARISGKARQERIRKLIKTQLNRALSMSSPNILNTPKPDPNKIIRSVESDQPEETTSTSYRLQHEPGWCDIGESCGSPYLPAIIKKRQGKYIPDKNGRYVASRQIATMTQE